VIGIARQRRLDKRHIQLYGTIMRQFRSPETVSIFSREQFRPNTLGVNR
jgi:hypothetical protein